MVAGIMIFVFVVTLFDWLLIKGGTHKEKELEKYYEATKEIDS